jgi:hypothetical protein
MIPNFRFDIQFFGGGGGSSTVYRKRDPEEPQLTQIRDSLFDAIQPSVDAFDPNSWNEAQARARDAIGKQDTLLGQFFDANNKTLALQDEMANVVRTGDVPQAALDRANSAVTKGLHDSAGTLLNDLGNRGVVNSSITSQGLSRLGAQAAQELDRNYLALLSQTVSGYAQAVQGGQGAAGLALQGANAYGALPQQAYEQVGAALMPAYNLWEKAQSLYDGREDFDTVVSQGGGCFITSAVCKFFGKPDDCDELRILRFFRDTYMTTDEMKADVREYYEIAPKICAAVEKAPDGGRAEYELVYALGLLPAVLAVQAGNDRWAYLIYKTMVEYLREKYLKGGAE